MYNEKYHPFYMNYMYPQFWEEERLQQQEDRLMQSFYPRTAQKLQEKVVEECDKLDYPGSMLYDEYPDKFMMEQICRKIRGDMETEERRGRDDGLLDDLIRVLLFQEMRRRRCRGHRCRRFF